MQFRTEIEILKNKKLIEAGDKIITLGSCFAENMAAYFNRYLFTVENNPFGVLYNPASIYNSLSLLSDERNFAEEELVFDQNEWHSFYHNSDFSHDDKNACLSKINRQLMRTRTFLPGADWAVITLGSAFVFKHIERNMIVSNCHKIPQKKFERSRLKLEEIEDYLKKIIDFLKSANKHIKIVLTVSPIRHWKDGAVQNQVSKSSLIVGVNNIVNREKNVFYFPSYEIMLDDLRDYRFYEKDMLHPSKHAIEYIWQKFIGSFCGGATRELFLKLEKLQQAVEHRPRNPLSNKYKEFISGQLKKLNELEIEFPDLRWNDLRAQFNSRIETTD